MADGDHSRRKHAKTPRVQSTGEVLGEHGKTLLGLVVARQSDRQQRQWLPGAVLVGHDVGPDLVMQQRVDAVRAEGGGLGDEQPAERHHQVGDVVAHLEVSREVSIHGTVSIELRTSRLRERPGCDARRARSARTSGRDGLEQLLRGGREWLRDPSVELKRPVQEPRRVAILQGRDLSGDLVPLRPEECVQRRVGDVLDLEVVQVTPHQIRLELQRSEPQGGDRREVTPFEVRPCLCGIDRREVEQKVQAALNLGEAGIDVEGRRKLLGRGCHLTSAVSSVLGDSVGSRSAAGAVGKKSPESRPITGPTPSGPALKSITTRASVDATVDPDAI